MGLKRNFAWMLTSRGAAMAVGFVTGALINRSLGPSGRGVYAEMQTWVALFAVIFGLSLDSGINHFANRERYGGNDGERFATAFWLTALGGLLGAAALTGMVLLHPAQVSAGTSGLIGPLALLLALTMLATNGTVLLLALDEARAAAVIAMAQTAASAAVILPAYALGMIGISFLVGYLILLQAAALVMLGAAFSRQGIVSWRPSRTMAAGMFRAGLKLHVATIATYVYTKVNQLIVFRYCGETEAGLYAVSLNLAFYAVFVPATLQTVLYPRVIHSADDYEVTVRSMRIGFYGWGAASLLVAALARPILLLYGGGEFLPSIGVFRVLMVAAWILPVSSLFSPYFIKRGAFFVASFTAVVLGAVSIALNLWLVPRYASTGAALATSATCVIGFAMVLLFMWHLSGRNPLEMFRVRLGDFRSAPGAGT